MHGATEKGGGGNPVKINAVILRTICSNTQESNNAFALLLNCFCEDMSVLILCLNIATHFFSGVGR
jgi:hypothetical protein